MKTKREVQAERSRSKSSEVYPELAEGLLSKDKVSQKCEAFFFIRLAQHFALFLIYF